MVVTVLYGAAWRAAGIDLYFFRSSRSRKLLDRVAVREGFVTQRSSEDWQTAPQGLWRAHVEGRFTRTGTPEFGKVVRQLGVAAIVKKPWKPQELAEMVRAACAPGGGP